MSGVVGGDKPLNFGPDLFVGFLKLCLFSL